MTTRNRKFLVVPCCACVSRCPRYTGMQCEAVPVQHLCTWGMLRSSTKSPLRHGCNREPQKARPWGRLASAIPPRCHVSSADTDVASSHASKKSMHDFSPCMHMLVLSLIHCPGATRLDHTKQQGAADLQRSSLLHAG
eukprot:354633-Chlamydomonas_euryale.AAC.18